jgi:hypothetical protein
MAMVRIILEFFDPAQPGLRGGPDRSVRRLLHRRTLAPPPAGTPWRVEYPNDYR